MSVTRFQELIDLRCSLEVYASNRAMPFINAVLIDELERIDNVMDEAVDAHSRETRLLSLRVYAFITHKRVIQRYSMISY